MEKQAFITEAMLNYFVGIGLNNNREYFLATHKEYERDVKKPLFALAEYLLPAVLTLNPDVEEKPSRIVSRIRRDTRFTKDKSPYRSHMWLQYNSVGVDKSMELGIYYSINLNRSEYGMGYYSYSPARNRALRAALLARPAEFLRVLEEPKFKAHFQVLGEDYKRIEVPQELDSRLHSLYRKKNFYVEHSDELEGIVFTPEYGDVISENLKLLKPLYELLKTVKED